MAKRKAKADAPGHEGKGKRRAGRGEGHFVTIHEPDGGSHAVFLSGPPPAGMKRGGKPAGVAGKAPRRSWQEADRPAKVDFLAGKHSPIPRKPRAAAKAPAPAPVPLKDRTRQRLEGAKTTKAMSPGARKSIAEHLRSARAPKPTGRAAAMAKQGAGYERSKAEREQLIKAIREEGTTRRQAAARSAGLGRVHPAAGGKVVTKKGADGVLAVVKPAPKPPAVRPSAPPRPPAVDRRERARLLAVRAQEASRKARAASLRADKQGKGDVAAKKDAAYRVNFRRSENLAIASGIRAPKGMIDVTPAPARLKPPESERLQRIGAKFERRLGSEKPAGMPRTPAGRKAEGVRRDAMAQAQRLQHGAAGAGASDRMDAARLRTLLAERRAAKATATAATPKPAGRGTDERLTRAAVLKVERALQRAGGGSTTLDRLRAHMGGSKERQDALIQRARRAGTHHAESSEGLAPGDAANARRVREAGATLTDRGGTYTYLSRGDRAPAVPVRGTGRGRKTSRRK